MSQFKAVSLKFRFVVLSPGSGAGRVLRHLSYHFPARFSSATKRDSLGAEGTAPPALNPNTYKGRRRGAPLQGSFCDLEHCQELLDEPLPERSILSLEDRGAAMPYCAQCSIEYVEGTTQCEDCGAALLPGSPPHPPRLVELGGEKNVKLVVIRVFTGGTAQMQADLARNILQSQGIPCLLQGESSVEMLPVLRYSSSRTGRGHRTGRTRLKGVPRHLSSVNPGGIGCRRRH